MPRFFRQKGRHASFVSQSGAGRLYLRRKLDRAMRCTSELSGARPDLCPALSRARRARSRRIIRLVLITCKDEASKDELSRMRHAHHGHSSQQDKPFTLDAMDEAQLHALRSKLEEIVACVGGPDAEATSKQIAAAEAAKALQAVARGMATRSNGIAKSAFKLISTPAAASSKSLLA